MTRSPARATPCRRSRSRHVRHAIAASATLLALAGCATPSTASKPTPDALSNSGSDATAGPSGATGTARGSSTGPNGALSHAPTRESATPAISPAEIPKIAWIDGVAAADGTKGVWIAAEAHGGGALLLRYPVDGSGDAPTAAWRGRELDAAAVDGHGDLWVADGSAGQLEEFTPASLTHGVVDAADATASVTGLHGVSTIAIAPNGDIWAGVPVWNDEPDGQALAYSPGSIRGTVHYYAARAAITEIGGPAAITVDTSGGVWLATYENDDDPPALIRCSGSLTAAPPAYSSTGQPAHPFYGCATVLGSTEPAAATTDSAGNVWIADQNDAGDGALVEYRAGSLDEIHRTLVASDCQPDRLAPAPDGALWVGCADMSVGTGTTVWTARFTASALEGSAINKSGADVVFKPPAAG